MAWFKVDDRFWSHPKTAELSDGATALWVRAGSWSASHLTDGFIPLSALRFFRARRRSADELVAAGLWSAARDGFVFHDWAAYQPSKEQVTAKREASKARVDAWRERQRNGVTDESPAEGSSATPDPTRTRTRTRPDPLVKGVGASRGTRIPEPFMVTPEMRSWAAREVPLVDVDGSTRRFVDFWRGATKSATKKDWVATWRNWLRKDQDSAEQRGVRKPTTLEHGRAVDEILRGSEGGHLRAVTS